MTTPSKQQVQRVKNSGFMISSNGSPTKDIDKEEELSRSALAMFRAKEEEIERKKTEVREKVQAQIGKVEQATKRLADIREVSESHCSNCDRKMLLSIHILYVNPINYLFPLPIFPN